jgi:hypothetical protein
VPLLSLGLVSLVGSLAPVPPEGVPAAELSLLAADSLLGSSVGASLAFEVALEVVVFEVLVVEVVFAGSLLLGGVISGVDFGVTSETLLPPPHAPSDRASAKMITTVPPARNSPCEGSLTRRGVPCDGRKWDSR